MFYLKAECSWMLKISLPTFKQLALGNWQQIQRTQVTQVSAWTNQWKTLVKSMKTMRRWWWNKVHWSRTHYKQTIQIQADATVQLTEYGVDWFFYIQTTAKVLSNEPGRECQWGWRWTDLPHSNPADVQIMTSSTACLLLTALLVFDGQVFLVMCTGLFLNLNWRRTGISVGFFCTAWRGWL